MGIYRRMGSHFLDWIAYNVVSFSIELLEFGGEGGGSTFSRF